MLRAEKVHKIYKDGKRELRVLKGIDLELSKGDSLAIVGPSGAGKSTLLHILGGIDRPNEGKVFLDDLDFYTLSDNKRAGLRNQKIGFVFQFYHLLPEFTALENVILPAFIRRNQPAMAEVTKGRPGKLPLDFVPRQARDFARGRETSLPSWPKSQKAGQGNQIRGEAESLLQSLGLGERLSHRPNELSGGEQQRVAIARSLINSPELLLCDEPTGNLDSKMGEEILNIIFSLNKKVCTTVVIVTHDKEIAKRADRTVEMKDGRIVQN
jgi:lipoprotein-releasing system ATP-binding protein